MNIKQFIPLSWKRAFRRIKPKPELSQVSIRQRIKRFEVFYKAKTGQELNLETPELFTEKLQWYKFFYEHPDFTRIVDKALFKKYLAEKIGAEYVVPLIATWCSLEEVSIKDIDHKKFVLKSNLQGDGTFVRIVKDKDKLDIEKLEEEIKTKWFDSRRLLSNSYCRAYYGTEPKVIVEKFVDEFTDIDSESVSDYKLYCFNGDPKFFYIAEEHFIDGELSDMSVITFFDLEWNQMNVKYGDHELNPQARKPKYLNEMIKIAKQLSAEFPFVRVDFFDTEDKLYVSELTFYPGGGFTPYYPKSFDKYMGDLLDLTKINKTCT